MLPHTETACPSYDTLYHIMKTSIDVEMEVGVILRERFTHAIPDLYIETYVTRTSSWAPRRRPPIYIVIPW